MTLVGMSHQGILESIPIHGHVYKYEAVFGYFVDISVIVTF